MTIFWTNIFKKNEKLETTDFFSFFGINPIMRESKNTMRV